MKKLFLFLASLLMVLFSLSHNAIAVDIPVSNYSQLNAAISSSLPWDRILLSSWNYWDIVINNINKAWEVLLESVDSNNMALIEKITISNSSNLSFNSIDFSHIKRSNEREWSAFVRIFNSNNIAVRNSNIEWSNNATLSDDTWGAFVHWNTDIVFEWNTFSHLVKSFISLHNQDIDVLENDFSNIYKSWVEIWKNSQNIRVAWNHFSDFYGCDFSNVISCTRAPVSISVWNTWGSQKLTDVEISWNTSLIWDGNFTQFIVVNSNNNSYPIERIVIDNNLNYNNHINGIVSVKAVDIEMTNNTMIQGNVSDYNLTQTITKPYIRIIWIHPAVITDNIAMWVAIDSQASWSTNTNNIVAKNENSSHSSSYSSLFVNGFSWRSAVVWDFEIHASSSTQNTWYQSWNGSSNNNNNDNQPPVVDTWYDIFLIAGQSNTHYWLWDLSTITVPADVYQWGRFYPNNNQIAPATVPLEHWTKRVDRGWFGIPFVSHYINNWHLVWDREVLIIPAGYGNSGFMNNFWNKWDTAYNDAITRVNAALASKPWSELKAILWHQWEYDASRGSQASTYQLAFHNMISDMRSDIDWDASNVPFIVWWMAPNWVDDNPTVYEPIENVHKNTPSIVLNTAFADPYNPTRITWMSDNIHYSLDWQIELWWRYYTAYDSIVSN